MSSWWHIVYTPWTLALVVLAPLATLTIAFSHVQGSLWRRMRRSVRYTVRSLALAVVANAVVVLVIDIALFVRIALATHAVLLAGVICAPRLLVVIVELVVACVLWATTEPVQA